MTKYSKDSDMKETEHSELRKKEPVASSLVQSHLSHER